VVVDGLFGTGLKEGMREPYDQLAAELNRSSATVFAVDVPSGLGDSFKGDFAAVKADVTLTVEFPKAALFLPASRPLAGRIQVVPIGFPPDLEDGESSAARLLTSGDLAALLPSIPPTSYKHARGTVGVFAGAIGTSGAALLAGEAAAVSGSGLVLCAVDEDLYPVVAGGAASVMVEPIDQTELGLERFASLLIGSGWSTRSGRGELLGRLLAAGIGGVLDADAINLIADSAQLREKDFGNRFVLTPHPGEFARLAAALSIAFDADDPRPALRAVSARLNVTVAYKSHVVWIVEPGGRETVVDGMNPAMGTGGTGDVFAGILASLIGSGLGAGAAARAGALLFQVAGRHARSDIGVFTAEQLFPYIAELAGQRLLGEEG
jgi:NAD(P)H-hydrate epimerase